MRMKIIEWLKQGNIRVIIRRNCYVKQWEWKWWLIIITKLKFCSTREWKFLKLQNRVSLRGEI